MLRTFNASLLDLLGYVRLWMPQRESLEKPGRRHGKFPEIRLGDEFRLFRWGNFMSLAQPHYKEILSGYESAYRT